MASAFLEASHDPAHDEPALPPVPRREQKTVVSKTKMRSLRVIELRSPVAGEQVKAPAVIVQNTVTLRWKFLHKKRGDGDRVYLHR